MPDFSHSFVTRLVCALVLFFGGARALASDPDIDWATLETPHFSIVYDSRQQRLAKIYAEDAEAAFALVAPAFGVWPEKTVVFLDDSTDLSNGSATPWPYPAITAYPVLPLTNDVVGDYGDWGLELLTHEYTHILNFAPANGIFKPLRWVFGSIVSPNALLPRWYSEGLAVEMETRYSKFGRLRSGAFLSIARAMAQEGKLRGEDIARINEAIPDFPGGNRAYLMGSLVWDELTRRAGDKIIGDLNTAYSRRIPFFIDGPLKDRLGIGWQQILNDVYTRVETRTKEQIALINGAGRMNEKLVSRTGYYTRSPAVSPDGTKLVYVSKAHNTDNLIELIERPSATTSFSSLHDPDPRELVESAEINRVSWLPDSSGFIFDSADTVNRYNTYSDLWRCSWNGAKKKCATKKLTRGLRSREPVVSPSGQAIIFVQNVPGGTRLASVRIDGSSPAVLYEPELQTRVSNPTFVSADRLVFSERRHDGTEFLRSVGVSETGGAVSFTSAPVDILNLYTPARLPQMTARGLVFLSDRTGISNLYLASSDLKSARAITNTTTRVLDGAIDASTGDVLYSRLEASGAALFSVTDAESRALPSAPPNVSPLIDTSYPAVSRPTTSTEMVEDSYHPGRYLWPQYWFPYGYLLPGGAYVEASTSGIDPAGRHSYALTTAYDTLSSRPSVFGSYTNATTSVPITLIGQDINEYLYSLGVTRQTTAGALAGSFFLPGLSNKYRGSLGWQYLQTDAQGALTIRNGARVSLGYTNVQERGLEISPETGGSISLAHSHYFPSLGVGYDQTDLSLSKFFSGFVLPDRHALAFYVNGTYAPALTRTILGRSTVGGNYQNGLIQDAFVMRGYDSGVFLGKNMIAGTFEYRFPILYRYQGLGTYPIFLRRLHAALFLDAITLDGLSYVQSAKRYQTEALGTFHLGTGAELKIDTTLFYFLPVQFIIGAYSGLDPQLNPNGVFPFVGIGI